MNDSEAFFIVTVEKINKKTILVRGRAYLDIKIGDDLFFQSTYEKRSEARVIGLNSYRRSLTELSSGMTGDIELLLKDLIDFQGMAMLYKKI